VDPDPEFVAVTTYGRAGASARVRVYDWCDHLGLHPTFLDYGGHANNSVSALTKTPGTILRSEWALRRLRAATVLLSRQASPFSRGRLERKLLTRAAHGVYDFDDALFADRRSGVAGVFDKRLTCRRSVQSADVVIAGNDYLADWASNLSQRVVVIPSCIQPNDYRPKSSWNVGDRPRIVWLGSPATETFLQVAAPAVLAAAKRFGARFTVVSAGNRDLGPLTEVVDRVDWNPATFAHVLAGADAAIAPLADTPYARGKSAYKLLQYAATALPMIGSSVGANRLALERFDGIAAKSDSDWIEGLDLLLSEGSDRRQQRGMRAVAAVRELYSFDAWSSAWLAAVRPRSLDTTG
jgi:glycosyltransferase involved in cell wall biosynthesis